MIEATKRIGGLSFGDILKHPRCADPISVKERFSKKAVNAMKETLLGVPEEEKKAMSEKAVAELNEFDDAYEIMKPHYIPGMYY